MKYFISVVTKQVIERHLIDPLPTSIISPPIMTSLTDTEVNLMAAEPETIARRRKHLEDRKQTLENGKETFRKAIGGLY